ncbi:MAG: hypothetical protein ABIJ50_09620 [Pseudomonadota bacterium]
MKVIEKNSRAIIEFTLEWSVDGVRHSDSLWADSVNMWRDCFVPGLAVALQGKAEGQRVRVPVAPGSFPPYRRDKLVAVRPEQFSPPTPGYKTYRVLQPGGVLAMAFSNRWFPPKAIKVWSQLHEFERLGMVLEMFHRTAGFQDLATLSRRGLPRPDDDPHWEIPASDPVYMVWGRKQGHDRG